MRTAVVGHVEFVEFASVERVPGPGEIVTARRDWDELRDTYAVYFTAGGPDALRAAREARVLVATARVMDVLETAHVPLDAVVGSERDPSERYRSIDPEPRFVVTTDGAHGGHWVG